MAGPPSPVNDSAPATVAISGELDAPDSLGWTAVVTTASRAVSAVSPVSRTAAPIIRGLRLSLSLGLRLGLGLGLGLGRDTVPAPAAEAAPWPRETVVVESATSVPADRDRFSS